MGIRNLRAICPSCGGKIHTQPKGLGHFTGANSWLLVKTGETCQHCGVALSGRVKSDNKAVLAEDDRERMTKEATKKEWSEAKWASIEEQGHAVKAARKSGASRQEQREIAKRFKEQRKETKQSILNREPAERVTPQPVSDNDNNTIEQLERLGKLRDQGTLTEAEFATQKAKLLGDSPQADQ